ncbi:AraC family transcriptional regulator [Vibrio sp. A2-1]|uniref:helix-turn-helix transcriptional regulator n=1 Tax=Vibrio sp. A2-1 TaxID=2912252 RepID=UPI001F2F7EAE|nr:AraC family transcriptional regulator [Vibrio sp. A2-1]MCF7485453.1 AraC family transcriptional regulator [Vibrio sp. A2-1]
MEKDRVMGLDIPLIDKRVVNHFQQCLQEDNSLALGRSLVADLALEVKLPFSMDTSSASYVPYNVFSLFLHHIRANLSPNDFIAVLLESATRAAKELRFPALSMQDFLDYFPIEKLSVEQRGAKFSVSFKTSMQSVSHVESELFLIAYTHAYLKAQYAELGNPIRYDLVTTKSQALSELKIQTETPQYLGQENMRIQYDRLEVEHLLETKVKPMADARKVTEALSPYIGRVDIDLDTFCDLIGIGKRTIQRALNKENTTFKAIKETLAFDFAKRVISQQTYTISDVALHLGYADSSQFIRAFKRVNGITPYQWKKGHVE